MKKIFLLSTIFICCLFIYTTADAQYQNDANIDMQPAWGPSGYDYAENYYLPDVEAYYCVPRHQFVYYDNGNWCYAPSLPGRYANYDLYSGYKVVLNEREPWFHFNEQRIQYAPYRFRHDQLVIRDGHGYGRGDFNRPPFNNWNRGRDWGYSRRDNYDRRQEWNHNDHNDYRHGGFDNTSRHDERHEGHGRGRW